MVYADDVQDLSFLLLSYLNDCQSFSLDLRFRDFECFPKLEKFLDQFDFKKCAEIHLDGEEYHGTVQQQVHSLFSKCIQRSEWLFIKDFVVNFS